MAFFTISTMNIVFISIGIALVVGVLVIVALKIFHQNKHEQQVELAKNGITLEAGKTYTAGNDIAEGTYVLQASDAEQNQCRLTLNGEEKSLQNGETVTLSEDDVLCPLIAVVATIRQ